MSFTQCQDYDSSTARWSSGTVDIEIQAKEILYHKRRLNELLAHHTGKPLERIEADTERDFFMSATEAKNYGLIDQVISRQNLPAGETVTTVK